MYSFKMQTTVIIIQDKMLYLRNFGGLLLSVLGPVAHVCGLVVRTCMGNAA